MTKYIFSNKGQTLIEVIAALAVGTIIITALLSLAARSNRNANFARTSAQATKLAQQGLEIIRNIDSVNAPEAIRNAGVFCVPLSNCAWSDLYSIGITEPTADVHNFSLVSLATCGIGSSWCLVYGFPTPPTIEVIDVNLGNFTREVRITDETASGPEPCNAVGSLPLTSLETKLVTVTVRWDDPSGAQDASVSTCISNL